MPPLSQSNVLTRLGNLLEQLDVTHRPAVYVASEDGARALPDALNDFPCVLVIPGATRTYEFGAGTQRHTYAVELLIAETGLGVAATAAVLPFIDAVISMCTQNVTLGGLASPLKFESASGLVDLSWGGNEGYTGYQVTLVVSEHASASPEAGEQA